MPAAQVDPIEQAKAFLRDGERDADEALALVKELKRMQEFGYARRLLGCVRKAEVAEPLATKLRQQHALCMSKDGDLPPGARHVLAIEILKAGEDLQQTTDQETLGIAGGILKRRWEVDGRREHLERSLAYYRAGSGQGLGDGGYTAINTAFILDQLAALEVGDPAPPEARARREEADTIRTEIVQRLLELAAARGVDSPSGRWWFEATLAEAYLGLGKYDQALDALRRGDLDENRQDWEFEATVRQLAVLARLRDGGAGSAAATIRNFLGEARAAGASSALLGRVGLALSGGGFRASLFHLGVLAKLAELDILRRVEILSCVSGGSIVGAHYYLKVRKLMNDKPDAEIEASDFVDLVAELINEFVEGVEANLRCRAALNPLTHLRTIVQADHTTRTMGELFEKHLYAQVDDGEGTEPRQLPGLFVQPPCEQNFRPKRDNWLRRAKVPMLVLNATTLNTGHNWQFTASWMGEPPPGDNPVDRNDILRRLYYTEAPKAHQNLRLGHAVAASACVPGLFNPVVLSALYGTDQGKPVKLTVRLVDGGVHDNQGTASLLEQNCSIMIVSDATGQMGRQLDPSGGVMSVPVRTSSILMARVRGAQYAELMARQSSSLLRGLAFVHLKKDLDLHHIDWNDSDEPYDDPYEADAEGSREKTGYGVRKDVQARLALVRTDLDAFSQAESYALMTSGYLIMGEQIATALAALPVAADEPAPWKFLAVKPLMTGEQRSAQFDDVLDVASERFFKLLRLSRWARAGALLAGLAALLALLLAAWAWREQTILTIGIVGGAILTFVIASFVSKRLGYGRFRESLLRFVMGVGMAVVAPPVFGYHLLVTNPHYLARGRVHVDPGTGEVTVGRAA